MLKSVVGVGVSVVLAVAGLVVGSGSASAGPTCAPVQNFVVGGTGDPTGVRVPHVPPGARTNIVYPASISPVAGSVSGDDSVRIGRDNLHRSVTEFQARCPGSKVNLVGYSLGAIVVSDECGVIRNATCYTIGNPKAPNGSMANLPSFIPGFHMTGVRPAPASGSRVVEICNARDLYCNGGNPLQDPGHFVDAAIGTYLQGQHGYPAPVEAPVVPSTPALLPVPNLHEVLEGVARELVPVAPIRNEYVATPLRELLPPAIGRVLPREIAEFVPGPVVLPTF